LLFFATILMGASCNHPANKRAIVVQVGGVMKWSHARQNSSEVADELK
jgi:hypothetical protein